MSQSILLLDCSKKIADRLKKQGFNIESGTIGYCNCIRKLPSQVYEKEVIIYNPSAFARRDGDYISIGHIKNTTPEYDLTYLRDHIRRGAILLIFINRLADDLDKQSEAYGWIPFMPSISSTKDHKPVAVKVGHDFNFKHLSPIVITDDLKIPIFYKMSFPDQSIGVYPRDVITFFYNKNNDSLGGFIKRGQGYLFILPEYKSNEDVINTFLNRVIPVICRQKIQMSLVDKFSSPGEEKLNDKIEKSVAIMEKIEGTVENTKEKLAKATLAKENTINKDKSAIQILSYYNLAREQEDVALFYLYKITEALKKKYGTEKQAKGSISCNAEWNLIGKLANASYADIRHAPDPTEKIKEWSQEDIDKCFHAAEKIVFSYFETLF